MGSGGIIYRSLLTLLAFCSFCLASLETLVLYQDDSIDNFTSLIDLLKNNNLTVLAKQIQPSESLELYDVNGNILFDNLLILPNMAKNLASNIDQNTLLQYSNNGGNILIVNDNKGIQLDESLFLNQLGIYPAPKGYEYIDNHNSDFNPLVDFSHVLSSKDLFNNEISLLESTVSLISNSEFLIPLLQTSKTSFTYNKDKSQGQIDAESVWHTGNEGYFIVSFQGFNNARVSWSGISSIFFDGENFQENLVEEIIQWTFQLKSVIKSTIFKHKRVDSSTGEEIPFVDEDDYYKIKDEVYFEIGLTEYDFKKQSWVPFTVPKDDSIQLEFIMLDPYYRLNLNVSSINEKDATYCTTFKLPDQHGMFKFLVDYKRPGYSYITEESIVPVRHLANDEYPRSWEIPNSSVYMAGYAVVVIGWVIFVIIYVLSQQKVISKEKKNI